MQRYVSQALHKMVKVIAAMYIDFLLVWKKKKVRTKF